jgi:hypothetical protein
MINKGYDWNQSGFIPEVDTVTCKSCGYDVPINDAHLDNDGICEDCKNEVNDEYKPVCGHCGGSVIPKLDGFKCTNDACQSMNFMRPAEVVFINSRLVKFDDEYDFVCPLF